MRIDAKFVTSAASERQFLVPEKPMLVVCGKSNSGKSTLINLLAGQKRLAKTSADPGRTRFDFGAFLLADLPGYGYAAVSKAEKEKWGKILDAFFAKKDHITHVFLLSDIRRDPSPDDLAMVNYLNYHIIPFTVVATKADKLSKSAALVRTRAVANGFGLGAGNVIALSAVTGAGKDALLSHIAEILSRA